MTAHNVSFTGVGGDGIKKIAEAFAYLVKMRGHNVMVTSSYGSEMRGSPSYSQVVFGDYGNIHPAKKTDIMVALDKKGFNSKKDSVTEETIVLFDDKDKLNLRKETKRVGISLEKIVWSNKKSKNMGALGALGALMGLELKTLVKYVKRIHPRVGLREEFLKGNLETLELGYNVCAEKKNFDSPITLERVPEKRKRVLESGNLATFWGLVAGGARFFAGYPITPSSDIMHAALKFFPKMGYSAFQAEDEISAIQAVLGASSYGHLGVTATSGPGLSLMQETIGGAVMAGIPSVIVDVQRAGPSTGQPTLPAQGEIYSAIFPSHGDTVSLVYSPTSIMNCYFCAIKACQDTTKYKIPAIILTDGLMGQDKGLFPIPSKKLKNIRYPNYKIISTVERLAHDTVSGLPNSTDPEIAKKGINLFKKRFRNAQRVLSQWQRGYTIFGGGLDKHVANTILCYGSTAGAAMDAVRNKKDSRVVALSVLSPINESLLERVALSSDRIIIPEMNANAQYRSIIEPQLCGNEIVSINKYCGERFHKEDFEGEMK